MPSSPIRVLVVEDDPSVAAGLIRGLRAAGFATELANDGDTGARLALREEFDVVLLDLMLPGRSGVEVLEALEGRRAVPVIVLTAKAELDERLRCFQLGAVDFVPKPFWVEEVVARIRTRLNLVEQRKPSRIVRWADAAADLEARTLQVAGEDVAVTRYELDLLGYLLERPGRAVSRQQLAQRALVPLGERDARTVDSHVARIRKKLGPSAGACIVTVWGIGYRFDPEAAP